MNLLTLLLRTAPHTASATAPAGKGKDEDNAEEEEKGTKFTELSFPQSLPSTPNGEMFNLNF